MATFATDELVSSTQFSRNFWTYMMGMKNMSYKKVWVLKNNEIDMVVIPGKIYERIWSHIDEMIENYEIYDEIKDRMHSKEADFVDGAKILEKFNLSL